MKTKKIAIEFGELLEAIKEQARINTLALEQKEKIKTTPLYTFKIEVDKLELAYEVFKLLLGREMLVVSKLKLISGQDGNLSPILYVAEADKNTLLAISDNNLYFLDNRIYETTHFRRGVARIKKIENGEMTAQYS